uniref:C-mannosyltransferase DPY19L3 n=1 Tax=Clytia hemisphaerica TaxID=252671 RepID=A0A7M5WW22_9CNID
MKSKSKFKSKQSSKSSTNNANENNDSNFDRIGEILVIIVGLGIALYLGYRYAIYSKEIHENEMWFSNIKQVEREISFRTESGLYFSYYKQLVLAPSLSQGLYELTHDNRTEHLRTINILERFNIYQEVILGIIYRSFSQAMKDSWQYVYFYIDSVFALHGLYMVAIFITTWQMSGTFLAGVLSVGFFVFNRFNMTRLAFTVPLRESFSLPFIYIQIAAITFFLRKKCSAREEKVHLVIVSLSTFLLTLFWQFAQFVLLLEAFALFGLYAMEFTESRKVKPLYCIMLGSLASVCFVQFGNDMLYTALVGSFCIASLLLMSVWKPGTGFFWKLFLLTAQIITVFVITFGLNFAIKKITKVDSDEHVFKFVSSKLGLGDAALKKDFDALMYLCEGGFQFMPMSTFQVLTDGVVFPVYAMSGIVIILVLVFSYFQKLRGTETLLDDYPEIIFNVILNVFFGGMALTTIRMKFLWMPHMCILAAGIICHQKTWKTCLESIHFKGFLNFAVRQSIPVLILSVLLYKKLDVTREELKRLSEFHDPDTVQLMEWIKKETPTDAAFTGSMQLMAGVKLCTDRPITNHPHYENKFLRERTREVCFI